MQYTKDEDLKKVIDSTRDHFPKVLNKRLGTGDGFVATSTINNHHYYML